jgi:hypothetical protein
MSRTLRLILAALAFFAVSAALAKPLCDPHPQEAVPHEACCASLADGAAVVPDDAFVPLSKAHAGIPAPKAVLAPWASAQRRTVELPPERPPVSRPFFARSARILI